MRSWLDNHGRKQDSNTVKVPKVYTGKKAWSLVTENMQKVREYLSETYGIEGSSDSRYISHYNKALTACWNELSEEEQEEWEETAETYNREGPPPEQQIK